MFTITPQEKVNTPRYAKVILDSLNRTDDGLEALKIITNYVAKTSSKQSELRKVDENIFANTQLAEVYLEKALNYMIEVAVSDEVAYSTGELAKYFGVSITAINKWVNEGRFIDIKREGRNKQLRISENTLWKAPNGETIPVKEVVDMYQKDNNLDPQEELRHIEEDIRLFEEKYNGRFEDKLKFKENKSSEEEADSREWSYLLKRVQNK